MTTLSRAQILDLTAVFTANALIRDQDLMSHCMALGVLDGIQSLGKYRGNKQARFAKPEQLETVVKAGQFTTPVGTLVTVTRLSDTRHTATLYGLPEHISDQEVLEALAEYTLADLTITMLPHRHLHGAYSLNRRITASTPLLKLPDSLLIPTIEGYTLRSTVVVQGRAPICFSCKQRGHYKSTCPSQTLPDLEATTTDTMNITPDLTTSTTPTEPELIPDQLPLAETRPGETAEEPARKLSKKEKKDLKAQRAQQQTQSHQPQPKRRNLEPQFRKAMDEAMALFPQFTEDQIAERIIAIGST